MGKKKCEHLIRGLPGFPGQGSGSGPGSSGFDFPDFVFYVAQSYGEQENPPGDINKTVKPRAAVALDDHYQFTTIQAAINHANQIDPQVSRQVVIMIAPGTYTENLSLRPNISLQGYGRLNTNIYGSITYVETGPEGSCVELSNLLIIGDGNEISFTSTSNLTLMFNNIVTFGIFLNISGDIFFTVQSSFLLGNIVLTKPNESAYQSYEGFYNCEINAPLTLGDSEEQTGYNLTLRNCTLTSQIVVNVGKITATQCYFDPSSNVSLATNTVGIFYGSAINPTSVQGEGATASFDRVSAVITVSTSPTPYTFAGGFNPSGGTGFGTTEFLGGTKTVLMTPIEALTASAIGAVAGITTNDVSLVSSVPGQNFYVTILCTPD